MKIQLIKQREHNSNQTVLNATQQLKFKVIASSGKESPLHCLPELIRLLADKHLNAYLVHFTFNSYGRFDLDIEAEYPQVRQLNDSVSLLDCNGNKISVHKVIMMDHDKKIRRISALLYPKLKDDSQIIVEMPYDQFIDYLTSLKSEFDAWNDEQLFALPSLLIHLQESYEFIEANDSKLTHDRYYQALKKAQVAFVMPEMNKACAFDNAKVIEEQLVLQVNTFRLLFNYHPLAGTPFHLMIIPNLHSMDLTTATDKHLFELEAILKALMSFNKKMVLYMKKHASTGMTMAHMHIHTFIPPPVKAFRSYICNQLRYFASIILHKRSDMRKFTEATLSPEQMRTKRRLIQTCLQKKINATRHRGWAGI